MPMSFSIAYGSVRRIRSYRWRIILPFVAKHELGYRLGKASVFPTPVGPRDSARRQARNDYL
jgi:hypothetical protein